MNRAAIKQRGKAAFKANYWKTVLVAFLLSLALGTYGASASSSVDTDELQEAFDMNPTQGVTSEAADPYAALEGQGIDADFSSLFQGQETYTPQTRAAQLKESIQVGSIAGLGGIATLLTIFLLGPLEVGCKNFLKKNLNTPAELDAMNTAFVPKYWHNLATQLLRRIFVFLWSLLLIIPGIIMSYAYEMTPYILNDHPELGAKETIDLSRTMMKGHKWELFVFDLSFIGWWILSIITLGIADIFYVHPYYANSHAAFYENLKAQTASDPAAPVVSDIPEEA
ncbi:MAG: DUF975 family protein [Clostridia bacterium]|nr:DUF975 family protein [Clostridia bacterium]